MGILYNRYTPEKIVTYTVTITINNNITRTGGALVQTDLSGPMTAVTLSPKDTYRINPPSGSSGITVTASGNNYVISGTPTADVTLSFTTTQNPDILTSTQKNIANWEVSRGGTYGFIIDRNNPTQWHVDAASTLGLNNEGYYCNISSLSSDATYQFSLTYKVAPRGSYSNEGCVIGVTRSNVNHNIYQHRLGFITISGTQTEYITETVNFTNTSYSGDWARYLAITNVSYSLTTRDGAGTIYIQDMTLRQI